MKDLNTHADKDFNEIPDEMMEKVTGGTNERTDDAEEETKQQVSKSTYLYPPHHPYPGPGPNGPHYPHPYPGSGSGPHYPPVNKND